MSAEVELTREQASRLNPLISEAFTFETLQRAAGLLTELETVYGLCAKEDVGILLERLHVVHVLTAAALSWEAENISTMEAFLAERGVKW
jgi:hypothetical protein